MQFGIYYAYWERQWGGDYLRYPKKVADLGFDILEISCASLAKLGAAALKELRQAAEDAGVRLTGGYGPKPQENLASGDRAIVRDAFEFWDRTFDALESLGVTLVGGGLYSYWPVDYGTAGEQSFDKPADLQRSIKNMKRLGDMAAKHHITLGMEALNRFEGYLLNTAQETLDYVTAVGRDNVKVMLDTFHMNIEEDSITDAIRTAGKHLGHFHLGEANRRPPREGGRIDWKSVAATLHEIGYDGAVVMEPFVLQGGQVGSDIKIWRDLIANGGETELDEEARRSVAFVRKVFGKAKK
ncbi:MAG: TIM barrel protein [Treponema sp.]|jgi:D-psicose/D-tagatose/L-ribulose 3-epimerase|nr:TIM barrel protein [Treponema sp.]